MLKRKGLMVLAAVLLACSFILAAPSGLTQNMPQITTQAYASGGVYTVSVQSGYLALRSAKAYDYRNEIGALYSGQTVEAIDTSDPTYWWVYAPSLGKYGYVNRNYLYGSCPVYIYDNCPCYTTCSTMTVCVQSGYLALRTAKAYDYRNEIGALYSGQTVDVIDTSDPTYWWVYAPCLGKYGYVNRNYLVGGSVYVYGGGHYCYSSSCIRTVWVQSGYLALRTAKAYDYRNEIGALYSGETVEVIDTSGGTYWWVYAPSLGKYGYVNSNYLY